MPRITLRMLVAVALVGCGTEDPSPASSEAQTWQLVQEDLPGALLSVWGDGRGDVWFVGADARDGSGPLVYRRQDDDWERLDTGLSEGTLWWVHGFAGGPVFFGGEGGLILRYDDGEFEQLDAPDTATVFGLWGDSPDEMWAVGGDSESSGGFVWRLHGDTWQPVEDFPQEISDSAAVWKVFGESEDDVWFVGSNGVALHWDGDTLEQVDIGVGSSLFTVHGADERYVAVGGLVTGIIVEYDGERWEDATPEPAPLGLAGVCVTDEQSVAVGSYGAVYARAKSGWEEQDLGFSLDQNLHGVWIDPGGDVWAVGGQTFAEPLTDGVIVYRGQQSVGGGL